MLLCIRITKLMVSPRRFFTAPRCLCSKLHSSSLSQSVASSYLHEECDDFLPWLEQKAGVAISSAVSIGRSTYGRSLFATKIIETGSSILKVPFHAQISPDNLYPEIKILLGDEVGNVARLATVILVEKKKGPESGWAPYISRLPLLGETQTTLFWSEDELEIIKQSPVYLETIRKKAEIRRQFLTLKPVLDQFPQIFDGIKFEDFLHAYTLVESRAWESSKGFSMIPLADFLNHDGLAKAIVLSDEEEQISEVLADRDYAPGEQIWITYGKFSNATLLLEFGFTLPHNIHDESELLERLRFPTLKDLRGFKHHADSFTIKEVRSATGKGYGIPQSLRAAARVLCCTSAEELCYVVEEAMENDGRLGRRPFKNIEREIQAHEILLSQITTLIGEYTESIKLLVSTSPAGNRHDSRERMAHDLLAGELRVLKAASLWLQNYILTLHHSA
ncbi:fructose-bisphosphate aldolase-lysine N-methyltransferase, chloroplastic isoform X2 [Punica granatum]|uniref:Fructose-bisphosphate aldolase-lysine N-methyltransferase, chloroplastic isoform X2 n=1 Tax=Punica granatum TaxID=22663 RepID=A0A6P8BWD2_PUNGR|nr:fructose-bisphosphate aldolase-lysine N-methyltransferase, chloroplastic isoform X2 [Punica granatum]